MLQQVLDLGREVERELRPLRVQPPGDLQRMAGPVQEIGIAEGDVSRAGRDLGADVGEHHVRRHHEEPPAVNGHHRAMPAQVQAAAARLHVRGGVHVAVVVVSRVSGRRRQRRAVRDRERKPRPYRAAREVRVLTPGTPAASPPSASARTRPTSALLAFAGHDGIRRALEQRRRRSATRRGRGSRRGRGDWRRGRAARPRTPRRSAVCMGTEMTTTSAAAARSGEKGSTARSRVSASSPARRRKARGHAIPSGACPSS